MIDAMEIILDCMNKLELFAGGFPTWKYVPSPTYNKFEKASDVFTEYVTYRYPILQILSWKFINVWLTEQWYLEIFICWFKAF